METKIEVVFLKEDIFQVKTQDSKAELFIDKAKEGYNPAGPNPLELFLSSLGACIGVYAKRYLSMHSVEFKQLNIEVKADFSQDSPARLVNIKALVHTDANLGDKRDVFLRFISNCPIHNTIKHTKEIEINIG
ncbi:MAG: OsmC family protein [Candidatus Omnitrophota bacterium]|nr:OsmC family protein [Candidatus Omnitrophota bacterium]